MYKFNKNDFNTDEFNDYIIKLETLASYFENFQYNETNNIGELYRLLHSVKAITYYYYLEEMSILIEKTETVIMYIINYDCDVSFLYEWFDIFAQQLDLWISELKKGIMPNIFDIYFEDMPYVRCKHKKDKFNYQTNVIISNNIRNKEVIYNLCNKKFKNAIIISSIDDIISSVLLNKNTIIITSTKFSDGLLTDLLLKLEDINFNLNNFYLVVKVLDNERFERYKIKINIPNIINTNLISPQQLFNFIDEDNKKNENKLIRIPNNKISLIELSKHIKPMSATVIELKDLCFGDSDLKSISNTIKKDPMFSTILLRNINTPFIGLTNRVSNINTAVSLLGKERVGSIVLSELSKELLFKDANLIAYDITITNLLQLAQIRAKFIFEWLKHINISNRKKQAITSYVYFLPIGQILINQALIINKSAQRFNKHKKDTNIYELEENMVGWSSSEALLKVFKLWNMPKNLIHLANIVQKNKVYLKYSTDAEYCSVIYIVTKIFSDDGKHALSENIIREAKKNSLSEEILKKTYKHITKELPYNIFSDPNIVEAYKDNIH